MFGSTDSTTGQALLRRIHTEAHSTWPSTSWRTPQSTYFPEQPTLGTRQPARLRTILIYHTTHRFLPAWSSFLQMERTRQLDAGITWKSKETSCGKDYDLDNNYGVIDPIFVYLNMRNFFQRVMWMFLDRGRILTYTPSRERLSRSPRSLVLPSIVLTECSLMRSTIPVWPMALYLLVFLNLL